MDLATQILDGAPLRLGDKLLMSVSRAKFEQKGKCFVQLFLIICFSVNSLGFLTVL